MCAKFHCPSSTVTLFSGGGVESTPPVIKSQKKPGLNRVKELSNEVYMIHEEMFYFRCRLKYEGECENDNLECWDDFIY